MLLTWDFNGPSLTPGNLAKKAEEEVKTNVAVVRNVVSDVKNGSVKAVFTVCTRYEVASLEMCQWQLCEKVARKEITEGR